MRMSLIFGLVLILGFFGLGYMHEQVHVEIYRHYGIETHVEYFSNFPNFVTVAESGCPTDNCLLANNLNEVVGYPLSIFYCIFGIGLFMIICYKEAMFDIEKFKLDIMKAKKEKYG